MKTGCADPSIFNFQVLHEDKETHARVGRMNTAHGVVETPVFMPVGTQGTVKALTPRDLLEAGSEIILGNTYHLYIRPGLDIIKHFGGLHKFISWNRPILTDSGGFQVFSLSRMREISEEGARFRSHFDGREIFLSPEKVIEIQEVLGSDIAMIFDECPPSTTDRERIKKSLELTLRWAVRAKKHYQVLSQAGAQQLRHACGSPKLPSSQALFGIIQGGIFPELRLESLERTVEIGFDGYALGGLCVGEAKPDTLTVYEEVVPKMPKDKPRYLMGIGTPLDFVEAIERGADMFDCVNPTRYGRNGGAFTSTGMVIARNTKYLKDDKPIEEGCKCYACQHFSRGYIRHLLNAGEMLGGQLLSIHNVYFFVQFVKGIREHIKAGTYKQFKKNFINQFDPVCR